MNKEVMIGTWAWGPGFNGSKQVFGNNYDEEILRETFERAVNLGLTRWDTAAVYGMGSCEKLLGKFINGRDGIFISTKFFPDKKFREGALEKSFHESMTRLNLKSADLFWIHKPNNLTKNLQEAVPLLQDGRIRSIGISNVSLKDIRTAEDILSREGLSLGAVQNHFSLLRNDQQPLIDYCNSKGITYYAYMVLEQGALAGRYNVTCPFPLLSMRRLAFPKSKFRKIESLLKLMEQTALKYNIDKSQIPVLWVIAKGAVPIIGITKPVYAERLAEALQVDLTPEEIEQLTSEAAATGIRQQGSWEPQ
ncbi:MAG: aldo/keto reductase [Eubacteriales bacterium]|jgi:aryl-alcohol dehydrogenase-like predicted oxidoreductase|nr:aldo/keto reductase [Butyrivibrio sp.]MDO4422484.1 aldo/keto reductase [Eubacteriales bacterium]